MEIAIGILASVILLAVAAIAYGIHLSTLIHDSSLSSRHTPPPFDIIASSEGGGRIRLRAANDTVGAIDLRHDGIFGIATAAGYGQVGDVLERNDDHVVRRYTPMTATINAAEPARLDMYAYPDNPQTAHGITYEEVRYKSDLGECPTWLIPGSGDTWVVFAHGRGAHRNEALRIIPTLAKAGLPTLVIAYRNDDGAPASADRQHWLGLTEWRDLEAAVRYALDSGAEDVILYGYSMGGGMCLKLLYESELADKVRGVVMDSPLLDFRATLDYGASIRGYPRFITLYAKAFAGLRFGIDWKRMNYLTQASELQAPMLLLHGEADSLVPPHTSRALAYARADIVRYIGFDGVAHARSWNSDRQRYETAVSAFLQDVVP